MHSAPWLPNTFVLGVLLLCSPWRLACGCDDQNSASIPRPARASTDPHTPLAKVSFKADEATATAIRKALLSRTSVDADGVPLSQLIDSLAKKQGLQWTIDKDALIDEGIRMDEPVDLHVADITLKSALRLILAPLQLTNIIEDEVLTVTTAAKAADLLETRVYDVLAIVGDDGFEDYAGLIEVLTSCILPISWDNVGGHGSVREFRAVHSLVVRQTQVIHEEITALLCELKRLVKRPPKTAIPPAELDPIRDRELAIRQLLMTRGDFVAVDQPFGTLLKEISDTHRLPLWIDHAPLKDEGVEFGKPVSIELRNVRIETALNHLLRPFQLTWVIEDEVLKVTTTEVAFDRLVTRAYDVDDLVRVPAKELRWPPTPQVVSFGFGGFPKAGVNAGHPASFSVLADEIQVAAPNVGSGSTTIPLPQLKQGFGGGSKATISIPTSEYWIARAHSDFTELIDLAVSTVEPHRWGHVGGSGTIQEMKPNVVVVRQTAQIQEIFQTLLTELRATGRGQRESPVKSDAEDPGALVLFVYHVTDRFGYPTEPLAKLIPEVVARETWQSAGGKGTLIVQPTSLVIRQTAAVHKEIVKLLYDVVLQAK